jgi:hypothetical protein
MSKTNRIQFTGKFESRNEAAASLKQPGDTTLIERGIPRMLLMLCPCGCGDDLIINLDKRSGPAWRLYRKGKSVSLFPSYWRETRCGSHFILWKNSIHWCDWEDDSLWASPAEIEDKVLSVLSPNFVSYIDIAEKLEEIPWDVLQACNGLVRAGRATMNTPRHKNEFKRATNDK